MTQMVLSTAAFCLWDIQASEKLAHCENLGFEHIQIALSSEKMVHALLAYLKETKRPFNFKSLTCHAPWCGVKYGHNEKSKRVLEALRQIHEICRFQSILVRIDCIASYEALLASNLPISIENSNRQGTWPLLKNLMQSTELPISLNVNRAVRENDYLDELLGLFSSRVERVMLSGFTSELGRTPLTISGQWALLDRVQALEVPLILEGLFEPNNLQAIRYERERIQAQVNETKSVAIGLEPISRVRCSRLSNQAVSA